MNNIIYLAEEFLQANAHQPENITPVILEEIGHAIDSQINATDTPGDEGEMFAGIVLDTLSATEAERILAEDDQAIVQLNGHTLRIEQNQSNPPLFTSGVFTVGTTGQVSFDFVFDGGGYRGELAVFSLAGMEAFVPGSAAFIREAARRSLSQSTLGQVVIRDAIEGAKFSARLPWERDLNQGNYSGVKSIALAPHSQFAVMLVPNGTVQTVFNNPQASGDKRPLFSLTTANPNQAFQLGQVTDVTGDGHTFALEDWRLDGKTDRDYNDVVFQVKGATGKADNLDQWIDPKRDWRQLPIAQQILSYVDRLNQPLIGVIDTGLAANHADIDYSRILLGYDYVDGDRIPLLPSTDTNRHGTHLVEIIAGKRANGIGLDGINGSAPVWISRAIGSGEWAEALMEFVDTAREEQSPNAVVNLSFDLTQVRSDGTVVPRDRLTPAEWEALRYAQEHQILVVTSAGNDPQRLSAIAQAAREFDNILVVGAADGDRRAGYSGQGITVDVVAPGRVGTAEAIEGTSVAAAQVTGIVSQIWAAHPKLNYRQVMDSLRRSAIDLQQPGWDAQTGWGLVNAQKAIQTADTTAAIALPKYKQAASDLLETEILTQLDLHTLWLAAQASGLLPADPQLQALLMPPSLWFGDESGDEHPTNFIRRETPTGWSTLYQSQDGLYEHFVGVTNIPRSPHRTGEITQYRELTTFNEQEVNKRISPWTHTNEGTTQEMIETVTQIDRGAVKQNKRLFVNDV